MSVGRRSRTPPKRKRPAEVVKTRKPGRLEPQSTEEHRVYIESELCRLTPEASRRGQGVDDFLRYLENLLGIVESWDEAYDLVPWKIRKSIGTWRDRLWQMVEFKVDLYSALSQMKRFAMLKSIAPTGGVC